MTQQQFDKNTAVTTAVIGIIIFVAIAYFGYSAMTKDTTPQSDTTEQKSVEQIVEDNEANFKATAITCAKEKVLANLKSPSTADFPFTLNTYKDGGFGLLIRM